MNETRDDALNPGAHNPAEGVEIPVRVRQRLSIGTPAADEGDDVVAEYESRYGMGEAATRERGYNPARLTEGTPKRKNDARQEGWLPPRHKRGQRPAPANLTVSEKRWAGVAHASAVLTLAAAMGTLGISMFVTLLIPLGIYFAFRKRSEFVARQALQAFAAQILGVVGYLVLTAVIVAVWTVLLVISAALILLLVGIVLLPIVAVAGIFALFMALLLPLGLLVYSMIAAVEALNGYDYSYPWVGDWVDDQLYGR